MKRSFAFMGRAMLLALLLAPSLQATSGQSPTDGGRFCLASLWHAVEVVEGAVVDGFHALQDSVEGFFGVSHHHSRPIFNYDVTIVGFVNAADGIGNHPILFKECLGDQIKMNFLSTRNIPAAVEDAQLGLPRLDMADKHNVGAVSILVDILADKALSIYKKVPKSIIKVAYTMFESTQIPRNWVPILNNEFDMAVVPDQFLVDVYKQSGVSIPVFALPLPLKLHDFLAIQPESAAHKPFVFGMTGGIWPRKNHMKVLDAFAAEYGNNKNFKLRLHGRFGDEETILALTSKINELNLTNVELIVKPYTRHEYLEFFKSLDCYVFLSMGEGFSITPREALACAKPCILTNNTAQMTICDSGAVRVVPADIVVPALFDCHGDDASIFDDFVYHHGNVENYNASYYTIDSIMNLFALNNISLTDLEITELLKTVTVGAQLDCSVESARQAMRDVYAHYDHYLKRAKYGREWVKRYLTENLSPKYVSLVKPKAVVLGAVNIISDDFLMTDSQELYDKYRYILGR